MKVGGREGVSRNGRSEVMKVGGGDGQEELNTTLSVDQAQVALTSLSLVQSPVCSRSYAFCSFVSSQYEHVSLLLNV